MSIARHHAEWLSLVPVSGPFLSLPVLIEAFPQGLDAHDPQHARLLRLAYEEWDDSFQKKKVDPSTHDAWIKFVLTKTLEFDDCLLAEGQAIPQTLHVEVPEHGELLKPNIVLNDPATKKARMLIQKYPRTQDLSSYVAGSRWKASPDTRMTDLLHGTGVRLGLVTNGEHWMLVDAPKGETTGYASWYASIWREEKITLQAFRSLLSMTRLFGVADDQTIEALLTKSASNQQEVTDQLGLQVRRAVEVLIQSLDNADQDHGRELLEGVTEAVLYESALTVMMRLVFLFCAEERELIPTKPFPVYEQNYSVSAISKQLREIADQHGEELLERRYDAWPRLLSSFRAVYGGLGHDDVYIPAYGGRLFDPDRFPFLEGRKRDTTWKDSEANPLPVNNRTVLHLLEALQLLQIKVPGGGPAEARRLSFRALDIEQIGHVYEGLLDHTAKRAAEPFLGLAGSKGKEPEVALSELEKQRAKGDDVLLKYLKEETGRTPKSLEKRLSSEPDAQETARFRTACQSEELWKRVEPFAGLIRDDTFGYPVVVPEKSVFVTAGTDRRSSGTHYTPRSLTEPIVQYTLEPLVYVGPAEGKPKAEWKLKSAAELLDLKICDMACGSGAFLVQAARYMSERLMEAWAEGLATEDTENTEKERKQFLDLKACVLTSVPTVSSVAISSPHELRVHALRMIAQRCLYGVDINPLAAEMAKLSLWLLTLAKDKPFEFLDHAIRCGDSLVGLHDIDQLRHFNLKPDADDAVLFKGPLDSAVDEAIALRLKLEDMPSNTVEDVEAQENLLREADDKIARLRCAADLLVSAEFWGENAKDKQEKVRHAAVVAGHYVENGPTKEFQEKAEKERRGQKMFHWPLEFPEVVVKRGGFDAFVGNPPFMHGSRIAIENGPQYAGFLRTETPDAKGKVNLVVFFLRRAMLNVSDTAGIGLIFPDSIVEGADRSTGPDQLPRHGFAIVNVRTTVPWPGDASLRVSRAVFKRGGWQGKLILNEDAVSSIDSRFTASVDLGSPHRLAACSNIALLGVKPDSLGFVLDVSEAESLLDDHPEYASVLKPYFNGVDLNSSPVPQPPRYVIDFTGRSIEEASNYTVLLKHVEEQVKPRCKWKNWWQFNRPAAGLGIAVAKLEWFLASARVTRHLAFQFVSQKWVLSDKVVAIPKNGWEWFAYLSSSIHGEWADALGTRSMAGTFNYQTTECVQTMPFPVCHNVDALIFKAKAYHEHRRNVMVSLNKGLTKTYNCFHDAGNTSTNLQSLRDLHVEMDQAVAAAYGWSDLDLGHGFHETKQGIRFTISEPARREVLQRLLKLNHERYAEEVKQGLHEKTKGKRKGKGRKASSGGAARLFE